MSDDQEPEKKKGPWEGVTVQMFFGALAATFMIIEEAHGRTYRAGLEGYLCTIMTSIAYVLYWLFKPRILKWRKG